MRAMNKVVFDAADGTTDQTSAAFDTSQTIMASLQAVSAGGAVTAVIKLQGSNDEPSDVAPATWSDIPSGSVNITAAGTYLVPKTEICYRWIRVLYDVSAGGGTITAKLFTLGY